MSFFHDSFLFPPTLTQNINKIKSRPGSTSGPTNSHSQSMSGQDGSSSSLLDGSGQSVGKWFFIIWCFHPPTFRGILGQGRLTSTDVFQEIILLCKHRYETSGFHKFFFCAIHWRASSQHPAGQSHRCRRGGGRGGWPALPDTPAPMLLHGYSVCAGDAPFVFFSGTVIALPVGTFAATAIVIIVSTIYVMKWSGLRPLR